METTIDAGASQLPVKAFGELLPTAAKIDAIVDKYLGVEIPGQFTRALASADALAQLRSLMTDAAMQPVLALMNSPLGFRTDRDPASQTDPQTGQPVKPYPLAVVREVALTAILRGYRVYGNEFNIIGGNFYAAKAGLHRVVRSRPGVTDFKDSYGVPEVTPDGKQAVVKARATWKRNGIADSYEAEIPIRVNARMGIDAILGKAERKLLARVDSRLTGIQTVDADVDEVIDVPCERTDRPAPSASGPTATPPTPPKVNAPPTPPSVPASKQGREPLPIDRIKAAFAAKGITIEDAKEWNKGSNWWTELHRWQKWDDMTLTWQNKTLNALDSLVNAIAKHKAARGQAAQ